MAAVLRVSCTVLSPRTSMRPPPGRAICARPGGPTEIVSPLKIVEPGRTALSRILADWLASTVPATCGDWGQAGRAIKAISTPAVSWRRLVESAKLDPKLQQTRHFRDTFMLTKKPIRVSNYCCSAVGWIRAPGIGVRGDDSIWRQAPAAGPDR